MKKFSAVIAMGGLVYLMFSYMAAEWNPLNFSQEERVGFSVLLVVLSGIAWAACSSEERR